MRICIVTLDFFPFRSSGLSIYAEAVARGMAARGHDVTVVSSDRPTEQRVDGLEIPGDVEVERVPVGAFDWIGLGWQAARYLRAHKEPFDIVHFTDVHFAYAYRGAFIASAFQSFRQRLTSHHGRTYHTSRRNHVFRFAYYNVARWTMERPSVARARHIIMPSEATQTEFVEHYGVPRVRTTLVFLGIDLRRFDITLRKADARRQLGLPADATLLLYVGFSTPRKGVEYLAQAVRSMQTPVHLVMVGSWETGYRERFEDALGHAAERTHILGYVPDAVLPAYFAAADAFVSPTLLEGFGIPLAEAMAAGLPVVTTEGSAAAEVVGDAGLTVRAGDAVALASTLDRLATQPGLARTLSQAGHRRAHALFDEDRMASAIEAVYRRVAQAP